MKHAEKENKLHGRDQNYYFVDIVVVVISSSSRSITF